MFVTLVFKAFTSSLSFTAPVFIVFIAVRAVPSLAVEPVNEVVLHDSVAGVVQVTVCWSVSTFFPFT